MITRAQAEALLTLAESLEACERLNIGLVAKGSGYDWRGLSLEVSPDREDGLIHSTQLRQAIQNRLPK